MELALEMGMPFELLSRVMTERELRRWDQFRLQKAFPTQRVVLQLASIAQHIAGTMGGAKNPKLGDYVIQFEDPTLDVEDEAEVIVAEARLAFGYNPRRKKE